MMKQHKLRVLILSLCALLLFGGTVAGVWAKYVKDTTLGGNITITAELGNISLLEHKVKHESTGEYVYDKDEITGQPIEVNSNTYDYVMPGVDIPKNPYITITNKSPIPAYLFVEVEDTLPENSGVSYTVDSTNWAAVTGVTGKHGGAVYVYTGGTGKAVSITHETQDLTEIHILTNDMVYVSQYLKLSSQVSIDFYVSLLQVAAGNTVQAVYNTLPTP